MKSSSERSARSLACLMKAWWEAAWRVSALSGAAATNISTWWWGEAGASRYTVRLCCSTKLEYNTQVRLTQDYKITH